MGCVNGDKLPVIDVRINVLIIDVLISDLLRVMERGAGRIKRIFADIDSFTHNFYVSVQQCVQSGLHT